MEEIILKIAGSTNPTSAAVALAEYIMQNKKVILDSIGVHACNTTIKTLIKARGLLATRNIQIAFTVYHCDIQIDESNIKTGVRWEVIII